MDMISRHSFEEQIKEIWSRDNVFLAPGVVEDSRFRWLNVSRRWYEYVG